MDDNTFPPSKKDRFCSQCGRQARRVRRRWYERMFSIIVPLQRYCCNFCGWTGLIRLGANHDSPKMKQGTPSR